MNRRLIRKKGSKNFSNFYSILEKPQLIKFLGLVIGMYLNFFINKITYILIKYSNNSYTYQKATYGLFIGDYIKTFSLFPYYITIIFLGYIMPLKKLMKLSFVNNIKPISKSKSTYAKSNGTFGIILEHNIDLQLTLIKLPTKTTKFFSSNSYVTVGRNANINIKYQVWGKAGVNRILGKHPTSRGVAMNPIDHPHGGRTKTNKPEVSLWGKIAKHSH